jgi:hypothetical protein
VSTEVQALLTRLVGQFAEPYDFLRELVQNALDAGSDRAEVVLETHEQDGDEAVFELRVSDAGCGMDEAVIDNGLTRLFASSKADDRTMAGGYGIGFVSVFAWEPEAVVVHTGKGGEAWELVFYPDRRFEKVALPEPVEGTTVTLLRRGQAHERAAVAEAVRDSLWRWCRFCRLEVSFEDVVGGAGPELIEDRPAEAESGLAVVEEQGDTHVRVAFAVPASAVLLRRGLILAEGLPGDLLGAALPELRADAGRTGEHVQVWVDSPLLRTTMARDKVLEDAGQREVLARVAAAVRALRERLVGAIEQAVSEPGAWTRERHERYAYLHAHLGRERKALGEAVRGRTLLRDLAGERGLAPAALAGLLRGRPVVTADVEEGEPSPTRAAVLAAARAAGFPVIAAEADDRRWLAELLEGTGAPVDWQQALVRERAQGEGEGLRAAVERGLVSAGVVVQVRLADGEARAGLVGVELAPVQRAATPGEGGDGEEAVRPVEEALVVYATGPWPESAWKGKVVWIADDMLLRAASKAFASTPWTTATALTAAVLAALGQPADAAAAASEALRDLAGKPEASGG